MKELLKEEKLRNCAMETRDHLKNGVSPKDQMNRENIIIKEIQ